MYGQQDYPIALSAMALNVAIGWIQKGAHIKILPETHEVYEALRMSNELLAHGWKSNMYCTVTEWVELIETVCDCGSEIEATGIGDEHCDFARMRSQGIWVAQEAMELGVPIRENGHTDFVASRGHAEGNRTHDEGNQGEDGLAEKAMTNVK
jgi:hypothetical protein